MAEFDDDIEKLKAVVKSSGEKIKNSGIFLSIFTENYESDPVCLLQLGLAVIYDKPIGLIAYKGQVIPENLKRMARAIEFFKEGDSKSMEEATKRLVGKLKT